ncbi:L-histidine N(alpha)-methyltransferase [bacterium]|nr:L-histidine N(alpha)-methyltransferase [bacterium]
MSKQNQATIISEISKQFLDDVHTGLRATPKWMPSKYFYDKRGSEIFEQICELDEYYVTRTEKQIMEDNIEEISARIGSKVALIEPGSGNSEKVRFLLNNLDNPLIYTPMEISVEYMKEVVEELEREFPELAILPVVGDFTASFQLPDYSVSPKKRVFYFPGSTIGNFTPSEASKLLRNFSSHCQVGDGLLIGIDLLKEEAILEAAYDDAMGVTAEFNLNLLRRMQNELHAELDLENYSHKAVVNHEHSRVEMHLLSLSNQKIVIDDQEYSLREGETIHTENSYKYTPQQIKELGESADYKLLAAWYDDKKYFSINYFEVL